MQNRELCDSGSAFYEAISIYLYAYLEISISPSSIYGGYVLVNDESADCSLNFEVIDSESVVFENGNQEHNGKMFLRYYFE